MNKEENEIWKDIKGYEGLYQASNLGNIRSLISNKILKYGIGQGGYAHLYLYISAGNRKIKRIHRLIAETFIPNPENKPQVNHKDGNKLNNCVNNLEWCTASENQRHSVKYGLKKMPKGKENSCSKRINQFDRNGKFIKKWDCMMDIQRSLNIRVGNIWCCCQGKRQAAGNYIWKYAED